MCSWRGLRNECVDCEAVPEDRLPRHGAWPFKSLGLGNAPRWGWDTVARKHSTSDRIRQMRANHFARVSRRYDSI